MSNTSVKTPGLVPVKTWFTQKRFNTALFLLFGIMFTVMASVWISQTHEDSSLNEETPNSLLNKTYYLMREPLYKILVLYFLSNLVNK